MWSGNSCSIDCLFIVVSEEVQFEHGQEENVAVIYVGLEIPVLFIDYLL